MTKGLSLVLLAAGVGASLIALKNKKAKSEAQYYSDRIDEEIERAKARRDRGEITEEECETLIKAFESLFEEGEEENSDNLDFFALH